MPIGYGTNIDALRAARLSGKSSNQLGDLYNQLSSGMRINRTSVDPAGQSVANTLGVNARVLGRARLNIDDGISQLSTTDSAYQSTSDLLYRMQELANQSASGSLTSSQRGALDTEFDQLKAEILRLQEGSQFNGNKVNRGGPTAKAAQQFKTVSGNTTISSDGRIATYLESTTLKQRDLVTGEVRVVATGVSIFNTDSSGNTVAYANSTTLTTYDRSTGVSTNRASVKNASSLLVSADGSTVAVQDMYAYTSGGATIGIVGGAICLKTINLATGQIVGDDGLDNFQGQFGSSVQSFSISPDGSRIAIAGINQIFGDDTYVFGRTDLNTPLYQLSYGQVSGTGFDSSNRLYFLDSANHNGTNSSGKTNVFRKATETDGTTDIENLTRLTTNNGVTNFFMTDRGNSFTFISDANPTGENGSAVRQLFKQNLTGSVRQLTNGSSAISATATVSGDGFTAIYTSGSTTYTIDARPEFNTIISTGTGAQGLISTAAMSLDGIVRGLYDLDISTASGGRYTLDSLRNSMNQLTLARGNVGSGLSRLDSARRVTEGAFTQTDSARHRITDLDIAESVAQSTRLEILRDTQAAVLAQASRLMPQIALSLLQ